MLIVCLLLTSITVSAQTMVNSLEELFPYLQQDSVEVVLKPGTYTIIAEDIINDKFKSSFNSVWRI